MPTYDYSCRSCGYEFDKVSLISKRDEPTKKVCPSCSKPDTVYLKISNSTKFNAEHIKGKKLNNEYREWLRNVKKANPNGNIKDY